MNVYGRLLINALYRMSKLYMYIITDLQGLYEYCLKHVYIYDMNRIYGVVRQPHNIRLLSVCTTVARGLWYASHILYTAAEPVVPPWRAVCCGGDLGGLRVGGNCCWKDTRQSGRTMAAVARTPRVLHSTLPRPCHG